MRVLEAITATGAALLLFLQGGEAKSALEYEREFAAWMKTHHLTFGDALEYARRLENYIVNDRIITKHNSAATHSFTLGHNQFSHLSSAEFGQRMRGLAMSDADLQQRRAHKPTASKWSNVTPPKSVDWVAKGGVTPVKNQGQCGSCWAFSTTGAVEGAAFVASGQLVSLSEQELVDCDDNGDMGCNGGLMDHAFEWIETHHGICAEADYTYVAKKGICRKCRHVVQVTGFQDVDPNDEHALAVAVAQQPVAVAIEADQVEFQLYKSGVFDAQCGTQLDHGVLVVGYGEENGQQYWKVKNSWGPTWGQQGYILLSRGASGPTGQCGIAMAPSYPFATVVHHANATVSSTPLPAAEATPTAATTPAVRSSAKISQCGDKQTSLIAFDDLEIHPTAPKRGKPIVFFGKGAVRRAFDTASFALVVRLGGEHVFGHDGALCGDTHVPLPLGLGHIDVHGFACPMTTGKFSDLKVDVNLPVISPAGNYNIELHATTPGEASEDALFCVNVELDLTMEEEEDADAAPVRVYEPLAAM